MKPILRMIILVGRDEYPTMKEKGEVCGNEKSIACMVAATRLLTTDHLHVTIEINGKFAKAFLNSGAQGDYMFPEFARHHGLELRTKRNLYTVQNIEKDPMTFNNGTVNQETIQLPIYMNGRKLRPSSIFSIQDQGTSC